MSQSEEDCCYQVSRKGSRHEETCVELEEARKQVMEVGVSTR